MMRNTLALWLGVQGGSGGGDPPPDDDDDFFIIPVGANTDFSTGANYGATFPMRNRVLNCGGLITADLSLNQTFGDPLPSRDSDGWPLEIPYTVSGSPRCVGMRLFTGQSSPYFYPAGNYQIEWDGTGGEVWTTGEAGFVQLTTNPTIVNIASPNSGGFAIFIRASSVSDPVKVRCWMPGQLTGPTAWHPDWAAMHSGLGYVRFMQMQGTDETQTPLIVDWDDAVPETYAFQSDSTRGGVSHKQIIAFCNEYLISPHVCIPDTASDDYMAGVVQLYFDTLDPRLRVVFEYTNEVWNTIFPQHLRMSTAGIALNLHTFGDFAGSSSVGFVQYYAALKYQVRRACVLGSIIKDVYGYTDGARAVHGLGSFVLGNAGVIGPQLAFVRNTDINPLWIPGTSEMSDFIGEALIAPYVGNSANAILEADPAAPIATVMAEMLASAVDETNEYVGGFVDALDDDAALGSYTRLPFASYEAGYNAQTGNPTVLTRMREIRQHAGMRAVQNAMIATWFEWTDRVYMILGFCTDEVWAATFHQYETPRSGTYLGLMDQAALHAA